MNRQEMQRLIAQTGVTAEKIRILWDEGVSRSEIKDFLEISYQHVHNVLKRSNRLKGREATSPDASPSIVTVQVEKGGRITLPREYVEAQQIRDGDMLICRDDAGNLVIMNRAAAIETVQAIARHRMPAEAALLEALLSAPNIGS